MIRLLEDPDDYQVFEQPVKAAYDAETRSSATRLRLVSLLWGTTNHLDRNHLFQMQTEMPSQVHWQLIRQHRIAQGARHSTPFQRPPYHSALIPGTSPNLWIEPRTGRSRRQTTISTNVRASTM